MEFVKTENFADMTGLVVMDSISAKLFNICIPWQLYSKGSFQRNLFEIQPFYCILHSHRQYLTVEERILHSPHLSNAMDIQEMDRRQYKSEACMFQ